MQVQWAFLAGLAVVLALIPLNRWLAMVIQRASQRMMTAKDERIQLIAEMLRGIRQIKLAAWEPVFLQKVRKGQSANCLLPGVFVCILSCSKWIVKHAR